MQRYIVRLTFQSPLHVGSDESLIGVEGVQATIHSDTLFSGMINVWARLQPGRVQQNMPGVDEVIENFVNGSPPFRVSSCFPYIGWKYYLPRPLTLHKELYDPANRLEYGKAVKERKFLFYRDFLKWCEGTDVLRDMAGKSEPHQETIIPRVTVDRSNATSNLFHCGMVYFDQDSGLYFLLEVEDDDWLGYVEAILRLLGESGIGGERSTGCGRFTHKAVEGIETESQWKRIFSGPEDANAHCLLSLYHPLENEMSMFQSDGGKLAYEIVPRRGWVYSSVVGAQVKRKSCNMLGEGSIVPQEPTGHLTKVTPCDFPQHEVYRYGYAMSVPIKVADFSESEAAHG